MSNTRNNDANDIETFKPGVLDNKNLVKKIIELVPPKDQFRFALGSKNFKEIVDDYYAKKNCVIAKYYEVNQKDLIKALVSIKSTNSDNVKWRPFFDMLYLSLQIDRQGKLTPDFTFNHLKLLVDQCGYDINRPNHTCLDQLLASYFPDPRYQKPDGSTATPPGPTPEEYVSMIKYILNHPQLKAETLVNAIKPALILHRLPAKKKPKVLSWEDLFEALNRLCCTPKQIEKVFLGLLSVFKDQKINSNFWELRKYFEEWLGQYRSKTYDAKPSETETVDAPKQKDEKIDSMRTDKIKNPIAPNRPQLFTQNIPSSETQQESTYHATKVAHK